MRFHFWRHQFLTANFFRHSPAFFAVEAEDQRRRHPFLFAPKTHQLDLLHERLVSDPLENERDFTFMALHDFQSVPMLKIKPVRKLDRISDRRRKEKKTHVFRQKRERKLPHDAAFRVVEIVEFVHHDGMHVLKIIKIFRMQKTIEEDLRHDDEDLGVRIHFVVSRHESNVICRESPTLR